MPEVDVFLIGVPKAGTTWLAYALDQHKEINLSDPKEPNIICLLYTSPSPRDRTRSRMPSSA